MKRIDEALLDVDVLAMGFSSVTRWNTRPMWGQRGGCPVARQSAS
ncbi:hypothetical protein [Micromonospora sp. NPDC050276]